MNQKLILASVYGNSTAVITEDKIPDFVKSWMGEWEDDCAESLNIEDNIAVDKDWFDQKLYEYALGEIEFEEITINKFEDGLNDYQGCSE